MWLSSADFKSLEKCNHGRYNVVGKNGVPHVCSHTLSAERLIKIFSIPRSFLSGNLRETSHTVSKSRKKRLHGANFCQYVDDVVILYNKLV